MQKQLEIWEHWTMECDVCDGKNKIRVPVKTKHCVGDTEYRVPEFRYYSCPECEKKKTEEKIAALEKKIHEASDNAVGAMTGDMGGVSTTVNFTAEEWLLRDAKTNPHELFQRMLTQYLDGIKVFLFEKAGFKIEHAADTKEVKTSMRVNFLDASKLPGDWMSLAEYEKKIEKLLRP